MLVDTQHILFINELRPMQNDSPKPSSSKIFSTCVEVRRINAAFARASPIDSQESQSEIPIGCRQFGCLKTSEKVKKVLESFPSPSPPPLRTLTRPSTHLFRNFEDTCISAYCTGMHVGLPQVLGETLTPDFIKPEKLEKIEKGDPNSKAKIVANVLSKFFLEVAQCVQLSVVASGFALYYIIYCYMQLVYYALRTAIFFHNADGPMKITIGVVTLTSVIFIFNIFLRLERLFGVVFR